MTVLVMGVILTSSFRYFYDLNDDVLIKDILSGAYKGHPSPMNNQILFPLSFLICIFYRFVPALPWYGLFLMLFQYASIVIIVDRSLELFLPRKRWLRIVISVSESALLLSVMLSHIFNLQYTYTVAMMAGAAIMWILAADSFVTPKEFIKANTPAIVILIIAFNLRSEMLLLMMPFVCLAGFIKWSFEKEIFTKDNVKKYVGTLALIIIWLGVFLLFDKLTYNNEEWSKFRDLFDARTELYDFQKIPEYEGNEEFYTELGLTEEEQVLFENYNFGIDSKIDSSVMWKVADYAGKTNPKTASTFDLLKEKVKVYIYEITHVSGPGTDYPWNVVNFAMYMVALTLLITAKNNRGIVDIILLFAGRSVIWLYMLMGNRMPERITHSLYFVELVLLIGIISTVKPLHLAKEGSLLDTIGGNWAAFFIAVVCLMMTGLVFPKNADALKAEQAGRDEVNAGYNELYIHCQNQKDDYFLIDVYSSVSYSEEVFGPMRKVSKANSDIMGGWICNSPLQDEKEAEYGVKDMESALLANGVYFVCDDVQDRQWLVDYYESKGVEIEMTEVTRVSDAFGIFDVKEK